MQAHADPLLGHTELDGVGYVVSELSPYAVDLDWTELTEPDEIAPVLDHLGRATTKVHCVSDSDSDHTLVPFQTEEAIVAVVGDREAEFVDWLTTFAREYAAVVRDDHRLFVEGGLVAIHAAVDLLKPLAAQCGDDLERFRTELSLGIEVDTWDPRADRVSLLTL